MPEILKRIFLLLALGCPVLAQESDIDTSRTLEVSEVEEKMTALKASALNQSIKDALRAKFESVIGTLKEATASREKEVYFRTSLETAPAETAEARSRIDALPAPGEDTTVIAPDEVAELRREIENRRASLASLAAELANGESQLAWVRARPVEISSRLPAARSQLGELTAALDSLPPDANASFARTADRMALLARRDALSAEVDMLGQEQISQSVRTSRRRANLDLTKALKANGDAVLATLEEKLTQLLASNAVRRELRVRELVGELKGAPTQKVQELIEDIQSLTSQLSQSTSNLEKSIRQQSETQTKLDRLNTDFRRLKEQAKLGGMESGFTQYAMGQLRRLPSDSVITLSIEQRQEELSNLRLNTLHSEDKLQDHKAFAESFSDLSDPAIVGLLELRSEALQALLENLRAELRTLTLLDSTERAAQTEIGRIRAYLTDKLVWMRSSAPINAAFF